MLRRREYSEAQTPDAGFRSRSHKAPRNSVAVAGRFDAAQLSIEAKFPLQSDPVTNRRPIVITANDQFIADPGPTKGNNRLVTAVASLSMDTVNRITLIDPHLYRGSGGPDACGDIFTADHQSEGRRPDDGPPVALHPARSAARLRHIEQQPRDGRPDWWSSLHRRKPPGHMPAGCRPKEFAQVSS